VERPRNVETTALGAAFLAGLATGVWKGLDDVARTWACDERFEPSMTSERRSELVSGWKSAVAKTLSRPGPQ
jgi:glycerol kinase